MADSVTDPQLDEDLGKAVDLVFDAEVHPWQGFALAAQAAVRHLAQQVPMDLWMVSHVDADLQTVVATAGPWSEMAPVGASFPWQSSFCLQMVAGSGPMVVTRVRDVPAYAAAAVGAREGVQAYLGVPLLRADDQLFGTLCAFAGTPQPDEVAGSLSLVQLIGRMLSTILAREQLAHERSEDAARAYAMAERDALTGLRNRRGWENSLTHEDGRCARYGSSATVVVLDVDDLKVINDRDGHASGDSTLRRCAEVLRAACRPSDVLARPGGDEFAVLAIECDARSARALSLRLRSALRSAGVRASLGTATRRPNETLHDTWRRADVAMYADKRRRQGLAAERRQREQLRREDAPTPWRGALR